MGEEIRSRSKGKDAQVARVGQDGSIWQRSKHKFDNRVEGEERVDPLLQLSQQSLPK